jgi:hypothetical protein
MEDVDVEFESNKIVTHKIECELKHISLFILQI